jgi:hypothetical protein
VNLLAPRIVPSAPGSFNVRKVSPAPRYLFLNLNPRFYRKIASSFGRSEGARCSCWEGWGGVLLSGGLGARSQAKVDGGRCTKEISVSEGKSPQISNPHFISTSVTRRSRRRPLMRSSRRLAGECREGNAWAARRRVSTNPRWRVLRVVLVRAGYLRPSAG